MHPERKLQVVLNEHSFETGRTSVMEGSRQFLVEIILFKLWGYVLPRMVPRPVSSMNQGAIYWCSQLMYHLFQKIEQVGQYIWRTL